MEAKQQAVRKDAVRVIKAVHRLHKARQSLLEFKSKFGDGSSSRHQALKNNATGCEAELKNALLNATISLYSRDYSYSYTQEAVVYKLFLSNTVTITPSSEALAAECEKFTNGLMDDLGLTHYGFGAAEKKSIAWQIRAIISNMEDDASLKSGLSKFARNLFINRHFGRAVKINGFLGDFAKAISSSFSKFTESKRSSYEIAMKGETEEM
jgi:hypothetical protein